MDGRLAPRKPSLDVSFICCVQRLSFLEHSDQKRAYASATTQDREQRCASLDPFKNGNEKGVYMPHVQMELHIQLNARNGTQRDHLFTELYLEMYIGTRRESCKRLRT